jgi:WD40 repeat protein
LGITKNVIISVNASGSLQHWHTTSGKLLHTIHDELNPLLCADFKPDGTLFAASGSDTVVRVYDEQTKKLVSELSGSASG